MVPTYKSHTHTYIYIYIKMYIYIYLYDINMRIIVDTRETCLYIFMYNNYEISRVSLRLANNFKELVTIGEHRIGYCV